MDIPKLTVNLKCLFCSSTLEGPEDAEYHSGDLIKCTKCGEDNDYDSVLEVAKEEGMEKMKGAVQDQLEKDFKGLFKKS
jgi:DNA-directed RNA polymerase subunit RPC12/RpoP